VPVIIAGGTGLYIKALLEGLDELPDPAPEIRLKWQSVYRQEGVEGLRTALAARNPVWLSRLADPNNSRRLVRALELIDSGFTEPPSSWEGRSRKAWITGIDVPRAALVKRIEQRVYQMYAAGLLEETRSLIERYGALSVTAAGAIGYAEAITCWQGSLSQETAIQLTIQRTRQLAKRQMTWFRHQLTVSWIPMDGDDVDSVVTRVAADWQQHGPQFLAC
jgi:tRNA dimethylallyltransferase